MTQKEPIDFDTVVAARVRQLREGQGFKQDEFAAFLRAKGAVNWNRAQLNTFENGHRRLLAKELFGLAYALDVGVPDLVAPAALPWLPGRHVQVGPGLAVRVQSLRTTAQGRPGPSQTVWADAAEAIRATARGRLITALRELLPASVSEEQLQMEARGDLEIEIAERMARRRILRPGEPTLVAWTAHHLWGKSATEYRRKRAKEGLSRQDATKETSDQIAETIEKTLSAAKRKLATKAPKGASR